MLRHVGAKMVRLVAREAAAHLRQVYEVNQRRAYQAIGADRSSVCYGSRQPDDGLLRARLREIASIRRRFGYRRLHIAGAKASRPITRSCAGSMPEERLQVRRRGGRKRALGTRAPLVLPRGANQRSSLDFCTVS